MNMYDIARQVTNEVLGEGTYERMHANNPDPNIRRAAAKSLVTTHKRQFVHILNEDGTNTICSAHPHYYEGRHLVTITEDEAKKMHRCKRCFPAQT